MAEIETQTKVGLISKALILLGEKPASALTENRYGVTVGANLFEQLYEALLQSNRWRFAIAKKALSRLVDVPLNEWQYAFQLPSDCLLPIGVYPSCPYEIYGDHIYSNASELEMDYMFKPAISELPAYFSLLMVYELAQNMAKPVTESDTTAQKWERAFVRQRDKAMFADAQARPNKTISHSPFTQVR